MSIGRKLGSAFQGKAGRHTLMPLTQEIGDAIASYIKDGRPQTTVDTLFIRSRAPFRALANHCDLGTAFRRVRSQGFLKLVYASVGRFEPGNSQGPGPANSIWLANASAAISVSGTSATPAGVFESAMR